MIAEVRSMVDAVELPVQVSEAVATGGSAAALATLAGDTVLDRDALERAVDRLVAAPAADLAEATGLDPARVRLCLAGAAVLEAVRRSFGVDALRVSQAGLREGLVLEVAGMSASTPYLAHWGLAEGPFRLEPDPRFAYERADHREGLARILFGITQLGGLVVITGEIGSGKTLLSQTLRQTLDGEGFRVAEVPNPPRTAAALLSAMLPADGRRPGRGLDRADLGPHPRAPAGLRGRGAPDRDRHRRGPAPRSARAGGGPAAHQPGRRGPGAPVVLLGQPELTAHIARHPQVAQRVVVRYHLGNMTPEEVDAYALHRTRVAGAPKRVVSKRASKAVYEETEGVPRLVNLLLANALFVAGEPRRRAGGRGRHPRPGRGPAA